MAFFTAPGLRMHYEVIPNLVARDTLLIHGNLSSNRWWSPFLAEMHRQGARGSGRLVMAEWRGCGHSSAPATASDLLMTNLAQDYLDLLHFLEMTNVDVIGHSSGGLIAMLAMAREPKLFHKCILLDSVLPAGVKFDPAQIEAFQQMGRDRAFCEFVMASTIHQVDVSHPFFQQLVNDSFAVAPAIWTGIPAALSIDYSAQISSIDHPILFIQGELDVVLPTDFARLFSKTRANITYREVPGQGHSLNIEKPDQLAQWVREFFAS